MTSPSPAQDQPNPKHRGSLVYRSRITILLSVAGLVATMLSSTRYGMAALVVSMILMILAAVWCILTMIALKKARGQWIGYFVLALVLLANFYFAANAGINLAMWSVTSEYRECVQNSLTISSNSGCQQSLYDSLMNSLTGR
ncbi:hypothetical protein [Rothia uropygioeca]|uniref:hypothetical protein n=1 Tax=Kocuria sp. 257 TaxID=2021970 RepID=UPI001010F0C8|nr:hypothetical protein [Kocuria sp. 257]